MKWSLAIALTLTVWGTQGLGTNEEYPPSVFEGMENISLTVDGQSAAFCSNEDDQCAFRHAHRRITVTSLGAGLEPKRPGSLLLTTFQESLDHCKSLDWAGSDGWRLPSYRELQYLKKQVLALVDKFPHFGGKNVFLWTVGFNAIEYQTPIHYDPNKSTVGHLGADRWLLLPKKSKASFRCVKNEAELLWQDISFKEQKYVECTEGGVYCQFRHKKLGLTFSEPMTRAYKRDGRGVEFGEAQTFCSSLNWGGIKGWRLPTYEEGKAAIDSLFYSYLLSRDGVIEIPEGRYWVTAPKVDDVPAPTGGYSSHVNFRGYVCDFKEGKCDRDIQIVSNYRGPYSSEPQLPRAGIVCVR